MPAAQENWLVFVDTNILLDFYRLGGESAKRQLEALERHKDLIITSEQIRMEFLKNRQKVIVDSISQLKMPAKPSLPPLLAEYQPAKMLLKHRENADKNLSEVRSKIEGVLRDPSRHDHVYLSLNRIFDNNSPFNLRRPDKQRFAIRNLARKRFTLGYPPRKPSDTSIGDAFNWEWIIRCANNSAPNYHVMIVSRDSDYGVTYNKDPILNAWLRREFKERVSRKRKIELTNRLTVALERLAEPVDQQDVDEEDRLLKEGRVSLMDRMSAEPFSSTDVVLRRWYEETARAQLLSGGIPSLIDPLVNEDPEDNDKQ